VYMKLSTGNGFVSATWPVAAAWGAADHTHVGDFNGDGRADLASEAAGNVYMKLSTGTGFQSVTWFVANLWGGGSHTRAGDFNGDGLTDIASASGGNVYMKLSTGNGFQSVTWPVANLWGGGDFTRTGDFNGDGLTDLASASGGNVYMKLSTGTGFRSETWPVANLWGSGSYTWVDDFNGDGYTDIVSAQSGNLRMKLSTGKSFQSTTWVVANVWGGGEYARVGDFNGDGLADIASPSSGNVYMKLGTSARAPDRVKGITTGHGHQTDVAYGPLTDAQLYTKGISGAFPEVDFTAPLFVVSSHQSSNGIGGMKSVSYRYADARMNLHGRGFRGFGNVTVTDGETGIATTTFYDRRYECVGSKIRRVETRHPSGWLLSEVDNTFLIQDHGAGVHFSHVKDSVAKRYELDGSLVSTTTSSFTYDTFGNLLTQFVDYGGGHTDRTVNTYLNDVGLWFLGRMTRSDVTRTAPGKPALTRTSTYQYDPATGLLLQTTDQPGHATLARTTAYQRNAYGNVLVTTTSGPGVTARSHTTAYDSRSRYAIRSVNALGHAESSAYSLGNLISRTGPNGLTTTWVYDGFGRRTDEQRFDGTASRISARRCDIGWCPANAVYRVTTDSSGAPRRISYFDALNREIWSTATGFSGPVERRTEFNARGEVSRASEPYFSGDPVLWTTFTYDLLGRETRRTEPGNRSTSTVYAGLLTTSTNARNQTSRRTVDVRGQLVQSTDALGGNVTYAYDSFGNPVEIRDPANKATVMTYDLLGNRLSLIDPDSGTTTYQYNCLGELTRETDSSGQVVTLAYDLLGRMTRRTEVEGTSQWEYDTAQHGVGALSRIYTASGGYQQQYLYDSLGRLRETTFRFSGGFYSLYRTYDQYGRGEALRYPSGLTSENLYDPSGNLSAVRRLGGGPIYWQAGFVNARGQWELFTLGNGLTTQRTYDSNTGLLSQVQTGAVQNLSFQFDALGNLTQRRDLARGLTESFTYDALNRLKSTQVTGQTAVNVAYDALGNLTSRSDVGTYLYGAGPAGPHAVTSITGPKANTYTYDARGNRLTSATGSVQYTSFNLPHTIQDGSSTLLFFFGPGHERFEQQVRQGSVTTKIKRYVGGLFERETEGAVTRDIHYLQGPEGSIAVATAEGPAAGVYSSIRTRYLHGDHLGSVQTVSNEAGNLTEVYSYDAWGQRRNAASWAPGSAVATETDRGFTGHEMLDAVHL
ncbi:MAG: VCBS repeat-containing protein, partial [Acidobacteria bacterium]|nr:VCBS repeat-containing protein [Acidobacteriota bacterium]